MRIADTLSIDISNAYCGLTAVRLRLYEGSKANKVNGASRRKEYVTVQRSGLVAYISSEIRYRNIAKAKRSLVSDEKTRSI